MNPLFKAFAFTYTGPLITKLLLSAAIIFLFWVAFIEEAEAASLDQIITIPDTYVHDVMTTDLTEVECLALNVYHEARNQEILGQRLVAQVTVNRVRHESYPDSVCGVVRQNRQFSWTHDGKIDHAFERAAYNQAYLIAVSFLLLNDHVSAPYYSLLLNYHATYVSPNWPTLQAVALYGDHLFYVRKRDVRMYD
jgi:spore germination cell wall hydrolase CwlJ-like protein